FATAGGWLQLYVALFYIAAGFAAATFVSKWASDETEGRLEEVLAGPTSRARWVIAGGGAAVVAVVLMTAILALGIGLGVGGLWRTSLAAEIAALVVVATYLVDLLAPALKMPDWFRQLALTAHMGQPMVGQWDAFGIVACVLIAVVGILLGAWGVTRRDVAR